MALELTIRGEQPEGRAAGQPGKAGKNNYTRRSWPVWREAAEGQFNALLRPQLWHTMSALTKHVARAGRVSAAKTGGSESQHRSTSSSICFCQKGGRQTSELTEDSSAVYSCSPTRKRWRAL